MTAAALGALGDPTPTANARPHRIVNAARLHTANPWTTLLLPWIIYAAIFALTYVIWQIVITVAGGIENLEPEAFRYNGGGYWALVYMMIAAIQAMNLTFRFALGISLTRREYYLGTAGYFVLLALVYGTGMTIGAVIERATDGWGVGGAFFAAQFLYDAPIGQVWIMWIVQFLVFLFLGAAVATIYVRWGSTGLTVFFIGLAALIVGGLWLLAKLSPNVNVLGWFATTSLMEYAAWGLLVSAVCAVVGFLLLGRATPRA